MGSGDKEASVLERSRAGIEEGSVGATGRPARGVPWWRLWTGKLRVVAVSVAQVGQRETSCGLGQAGAGRSWRGDLGCWGRKEEGAAQEDDPMEEEGKQAGWHRM